MEFVSWDHDILYMMGKITFMFQTNIGDGFTPWIPWTTMHFECPSASPSKLSWQVQFQCVFHPSSAAPSKEHVSEPLLIAITCHKNIISHYVCWLLWHVMAIGNQHYTLLIATAICLLVILLYTMSRSVENSTMSRSSSQSWRILHIYVHHYPRLFRTLKSDIYIYTYTICIYIYQYKFIYMYSMYIYIYIYSIYIYIWLIYKYVWLIYKYIHIQHILYYIYSIYIYIQYIYIYTVYVYIHVYWHEIPWNPILNHH